MVFGVQINVNYASLDVRKKVVHTIDAAAAAHTGKGKKTFLSDDDDDVPHSSRPSHRESAGWLCFLSAAKAIWVVDGGCHTVFSARTAPIINT